MFRPHYLRLLGFSWYKNRYERAVLLFTFSLAISHDILYDAHLFKLALFADTWLSDLRLGRQKVDFGI